MYKLTIEELGKYKIYILSDEKSNSFVKFSLEKGATISDLKLKGRSIYDGYNNIEDLESLAWGRGILLAPFPNRLKAGKYSFEGLNYQFPINDSDTGTALHGFISQLEFVLGKFETKAERASISCHTAYSGEFKYYPFPFTAEVQYAIDKVNGFSLRFSLTNSGNSNMPVGLGWHPYFNLSDSVNDTILTLPDLDKIEIDDNMIPTGKSKPFKVFENPTKIDDFVLDNCFRLSKKSRMATVILEGDKGKLTYKQKTDIPYLQIFTPPHRKSIAIEPMSCNIDAFNNGNGMKILAPKKAIVLECQVNID